MVYVLVVMIPNVLTDIYLLSIPLPLLWAVRIGLRRKITLMGLFSGAIFVAVAAIVRAVIVIIVRPPPYRILYIVHANANANDKCIGRLQRRRRRQQMGLPRILRLHHRRKPPHHPTPHPPRRKQTRSLGSIQQQRAKQLRTRSVRWTAARGRLPACLARHGNRKVENGYGNRRRWMEGSAAAWAWVDGASSFDGDGE